MIHNKGGVIIIGAGLAGLFAALKLAPLPVIILSPEALGTGASSAWAQGGIAAALATGDSPQAHTADTMVAGTGLVDPDIALSVTQEARERIYDLLDIGTPFDRTEDGDFVLSREAAHSVERVARVGGDQAGRAIMRVLVENVQAADHIQVFDTLTAQEMIVHNGRVSGVYAANAHACYAFSAPAILLATGGIGGLYAVSTNPARVCAQGLGMAARAGAVLSDLEFVQFHPTALDVPTNPAPLASEALRGAGAILVDETGYRFMQGIHPDAELAPRDVVARAVFAHQQAGHQIFLDTRQALGERVLSEFEIVAQHCKTWNIDPVANPIPVTPAQHYHMGGVKTDTNGRSSLQGLWACGEVSRTGLHGANRLASNSLMEAIVFAARIATDIKQAPLPKISMPALQAPQEDKEDQGAKQMLQYLMTQHVHLQRDSKGLRKTIYALSDMIEETGSTSFLNTLTAALCITVAAYLRKESRGSHYRTDYPETDANLAQSFDLMLKDIQTQVYCDA